MKICAIICEFNPFHSGHEYLIEQAKRMSGCDAVLCIMSGNFTQRGEMCINGKYIRAKHAILGGADCVIQLPAPFAVAPAEIFASGAVKILSAIPDIKYLAFGCENADLDYYKNAEISLNESENFKTLLQNGLNEGDSYVKSYSRAFSSCGGDVRIVRQPNNVLGLEYVKSILKLNSKIKILPIQRIGGNFSDGTVYENYSSAFAIRNGLNNEKVKKCVPEFVLNDLPKQFETNEYENYLRYVLFNSEKSELKRIYGCGEGLENKLKSLENMPFGDIIRHTTSKRYSSSRIRRILCANALELYRDDCEKYLSANLYIKPLAVKRLAADKILSALSKSKYPVVTGIDTENLNTTAKECFEQDRKEFEMYNFLTHSDNKDYMVII